jgi:hypothetical protein
VYNEFSSSFFIHLNFLLFLIGDPCCDGVFDGSGDVALSPAVYLDSRESKRCLQVIGEECADASHVNHHIYCEKCHVFALAR